MGPCTRPAAATRTRPRRPGNCPGSASGVNSENARVWQLLKKQQIYKLTSRHRVPRCELVYLVFFNKNSRYTSSHRDTETQRERETHRQTDRQTDRRIDRVSIQIDSGSRDRKK